MCKLLNHAVPVLHAHAALQTHTLHARLHSTQARSDPSTKLRFLFSGLIRGNKQTMTGMSKHTEHNMCKDVQIYAILTPACRCVLQLLQHTDVWNTDSSRQMRAATAPAGRCVLCLLQSEGHKSQHADHASIFYFLNWFASSISSTVGFLPSLYLFQSEGHKIQHADDAILSVAFENPFSSSSFL